MLSVRLFRGFSAAHSRFSSWNNMAEQQFDAVIVGAGIIGSSTAYHLQKGGRKTLLIEQFTLGHTKGSSHGKSRITKFAHPEPEYVALASDSTAQIRDLEKNRGVKMIAISERGGIIYGSKERMEKTAATLKKFDFPSELLTSQEAMKRYPHYTYGDDYTALVDPNMGLILADTWLEAFQDEFRKFGGTVSENTKVNGFKEDNSSVLLNTSNGDFRAPKVVFALGSWINKLLPEIPVKGKIEIISVCYWTPKDPSDLPLVTPQNHPVHIAYEEGRSFLSMGATDVEGAVKFILHGGQEHFDTDVPLENVHEKFVEDVRAHIAKNVPFLDTVNGPVKVERCKYTLSPDKHYVIDYLPGSKNIQVAGCMSGTGFKNSPAIGKAVAQRAMGEQPFTDLSLFSINRFNKNT
ncbi:hypothetical protein PRIPAC_78966 [Pristionchus pacificus]|uniref:FAD dependent oxidoreductase n=1 Tax=Pristionchus pacificus TaxID=54126 RepID=A0A2A6C2R2_PRIPA|nr:hypothetical protein PRIPAC_78966 [Pristionchus pacificus]|eukprot:PDM72464.1 FAD dependent oxidoreductase [Pristionchus pacificus]